ncbi:MAG: membrane protein insertion efficiency factor YidD [Vampirovibrionales bacterium]|nr:membrane protein insertion efficiency factor YidD [Vampirovibrionales bacterium]
MIASGSVAGLIALVRLYQMVTVGVPHRCRFYPSCSRYMIVALNTHGLRHGLWLTLKRLGRCHPFAPWSPEAAVDPVPPSSLSSFTL